MAICGLPPVLVFALLQLQKCRVWLQMPSIPSFTRILSLLLRWSSPGLLGTAQAEQLRFCEANGLTGKVKPAPWLEVPWSEGQPVRQLQLPPMVSSKKEERPPTTHLVLRQGLQASVAGRSETFQQYIFMADDVVSGWVFSTGEWEKGEVQQLVQRLQGFAKDRQLSPKDVYFVDVGANLGVFTLTVAAYGFSVLAFEPLNANIQALRFSLCANAHLMSRITLIGKGLGNSTATCSIYSGESNQGDGVVVCERGYYGPGDIKRGTLRVVRLDDELEGLVGQLEGRVGAVKIDVEGHELLVVEGGLKFFERVKPSGIMAECSDKMMTAATGRNAGALFSKLSGLGYTVHKERFDGPQIQPEQFAKWEEPSIVNYWFTHKDALV